MNIRQLKYFVQIIESGSLSKASRQLFIAQPALSQQMAHLEEEVGKPLLIRSSRGVKSTENGDALYHHARFILRQLDQAVSIARREHANVSGRVTLGMAPTTVCALGLPLIRHLRSKYPGIVLNIIEALSGHLGHMAQLGELDLVILFSTTAASDLCLEPLLEEELFVILPRDSKIIAQQRKNISLHEVSKLPLILPSAGHGLRRRITLGFERANLAVDAVAEIDSLPLLMRCVADGIGVTIKPMAAIYALQNKPSQWRCLRITDTEMNRRNYLYALTPEKLSPAGVIVHSQIKHMVRTLIETHIWQGVRLLSLADLSGHKETTE